MKRETVTAVLKLVEALRGNLDSVIRVVDEEALPVGDRNLIDRAFHTITSEVDVLSQTFANMLEDDTKTDG